LPCLCCLLAYGTLESTLMKLLVCLLVVMFNFWKKVEFGRIVLSMKLSISSLVSDGAIAQWILRDLHLRNGDLSGHRSPLQLRASCKQCPRFTCAQ
jgi:hypothetical protein